MSGHGIANVAATAATPPTAAARSAPSFDMVDAIRTKRDGGRLSAEQIEAIVSGYVGGSIPDYQVSALLMAICWRGLDDDETLQLTEAMVRSGDVLDPAAQLGRVIVDKHSTGGVGDKTSLALAPMVAACGVPIGKMSGRGLGHTGGTLDKLESIPGLTVDLDEDRFVEQVRGVGVAIAGQTGDLVPADKLLYALRDVTGTVESIPLIAASIMSKKLAAGAQAIVLDVKVGSGAFMQDLESARELADRMIAIGRGSGREVRVLITEMEHPLGLAVGNALEVREVVELLDGAGPADLRELVLASAALLLSLSDLGIDEAEAMRRATAALDDGSARRTWNDWIRAQDGDPDAALAEAPVQLVVPAPATGIIVAMDALNIGLAAARLGAGRTVKDAPVDHAVGIQLRATVGDGVVEGDPLLVVHARADDAAQAAAVRILGGVVIDAGAVPERTRRSVVIERRG